MKKSIESLGSFYTHKGSCCNFQIVVAIKERRRNLIATLERHSMYGQLIATMVSGLPPCEK
jgi:hypothetical protein